MHSSVYQPIENAMGTTQLLEGRGVIPMLRQALQTLFKTGVLTGLAALAGCFTTRLVSQGELRTLDRNAVIRVVPENGEDTKRFGVSVGDAGPDSIRAIPLRYGP